MKKGSSIPMILATAAVPVILDAQTSNTSPQTHQGIGKKTIAQRCLGMI